MVQIVLEVESLDSGAVLKGIAPKVVLCSYRGTSLIKNSAPLGPYSSPLP